MVAEDLQIAIERRCGCSATLVQTVPVQARVVDGQSWDVVVHVYGLDGCDKTNRAYAWESEGVYTALDIGPIRSPEDAVNAILADLIREHRLALKSERQAVAAA